MSGWVILLVGLVWVGSRTLNPGPSVCSECDNCYAVVTQEVNHLDELATNISTVADTFVLNNSSSVNNGTFYDRLMQTRTAVADLIDSVITLLLVLIVIINEVLNIR